MNKAYLLTGGNLGNRALNLFQAKTLIQQFCGNVLKYSHLYQTAPWGKPDQPDYFNQCLIIETNLEPESLLGQILKIEKMIGRKRDEKYGPRLIDIDLLFYNQEIINSDLLQVPHPQLPFRKFALTPLAEIAAEYIHPQNKKRVRELLDECKDDLPVHKILNE